MFIEATQDAGQGELDDHRSARRCDEGVGAGRAVIRAVPGAGISAIDPEFFAEHDIHIHVPAGAVPKDGPSAGVAMTIALVSLLTGIPVREDVAMTGEITLRGQVLPVGGIKEKSLAARRAGITTFVLPRRNEVDLDDLPKELADQMTFVLADKIEDVLAVAMPEEFHNLRGGKPDTASSGKRRQAIAAARLNQR